MSGKNHVPVALSYELKEILKKVSEKTGVPQAEIIRRGIIDLLKTYPEGRKLTTQTP